MYFSVCSIAPYPYSVWQGSGSKDDDAGCPFIVRMIQEKDEMAIAAATATEEGATSFVPGGGDRPNMCNHNRHNNFSQTQCKTSSCNESISPNCL